MNEPRPASYVNGVLITPEVAYLLDANLDLTAARTRARGADTKLYDALHAIRWTALKWAASVNGSVQRKPTEQPVNWYTPRTIAGQMGITEHGVRLAIRQGRLRAQKHDGRWRIAPVDYAAYRKHQ